jgi:hypothetical protein
VYAAAIASIMVLLALLAVVVLGREEMDEAFAMAAWAVILALLPYRCSFWPSTVQDPVLQ